MISPIKFLGASVTKLDASIGWGSQESRLQCNLVEDYRAGDSFEPVEVGLPVVFDCNGWIFAGLLESWQRNNDFSTNPGYSVSVVDPRVLLDGVHLMLSDYYGVTGGIPNLLNIYGYLENLNGFGGSRSNESGIEWWRIVQTVNDLTLLEQPSLYGGPISYKTIRYNINLSLLPQIPNYYRVSGSPSISLMDFINEICDVGGCEYFVTLVGSTITINTVSRNNIPLAGVINRFVTETTGAESKNVGLDMVNDICSKFLVGGKKSDIFFASYGDGPDNDITNTLDNPIWQYWGKDGDGNLVASNGPNGAFVLDARGVLIANVPDSYPTDIDEMRASLSSQDAWETYLWLYCFNEYVFDNDGLYTDYLFKIDDSGDMVKQDALLTAKPYKHNMVPNPHFKKAFNIGLGCKFNYNIASYLNNANPADIINANQALYRQYTLPGYNKEQQDNMTKLYSLIRSYAEEYYGRKFMVNLPTVYVKQDSETGELFYTHNPVEAGYLEDDVISNAINTNLMPVQIDGVSLPDGRITAYVRFDDISLYDLSELSPQDLMFGKNLVKKGRGTTYTGTTSVFIRCSIDENLVFLDNNTFSSPRAVITLTSRVLYKEPEYGSTVIAAYLNTQSQNNEWPQPSYTAVTASLINSPLGDLYSTLTFPSAATPNIAAVPIESNIDTYGPWYAQGANGRIEVEQAEDLVPWNYNGFANLNLAAEARVTESIANLQWIESGDITFPDFPTYQLGSQLLQQGPYITDISISMGTDKISTTYRMRSWNPKFGKLSKYNVDRMQKSVRLSQQLRRNVQEKIRLNSFKGRYLEVARFGGLLP